MSLSWWNAGDPSPADDLESSHGDAANSNRAAAAAAAHDAESITPKTERERSNGASAAAVPGSPSIVFLSRPVVVPKRAGEKTGLLPRLNR